MATPTVQLTLGPVEVEKLSPGRETIRPVSGDKVSLTSLLVLACEQTGLQEKDAAISQGYDPRYWPRIKSGEKSAHLERIAGLPERTQRDFVKRYGRQLGLRVSEEDATAHAALDLAAAAIRFVQEAS